MSPTTVAKLLSYGRLAIGLGGLVAPQSWGGWVGRIASQPDGQVLIRGFGARETLLGFLAAHVVDRPGVGKRTVGAIALLDVVDLASTLNARKSLPSAGVAGTVAIAGGAAAAGLWASAKME